MRKKRDFHHSWEGKTPDAAGPWPADDYGTQDAYLGVGCEVVMGRPGGGPYLWV